MSGLFDLNATGKTTYGEMRNERGVKLRPPRSPPFVAEALGKVPANGNLSRTDQND